MLRKTNWVLVVLLMNFVTAGCLTTTAQKVLPKHDEVLIYSLPYDLTYLRTLNAVQSLPDWELEDTEKENGIIRVRNMSLKLNSPEDTDYRSVTFLVKRISGEETSVQLMPDSQRVLGVGDLLEAISQYLKKEL